MRRGIDETSLVERLGRARDARLLIVTSDDLGFAHAVNAAFIDAIDAGFLTSGSVMVPCPWFGEIAAFGRRRPDVDLGIHLTVTSECATYRWGPVLGASAVPSLVVGDGGFPITEAEVLERADLGELEAELRAQVARARDAGIDPTHLDSHMGVLYQRDDVLAILARIAADERLPIRHPRHWAGAHALATIDEAAGPVTNDHIASVSEGTPAEHWPSFYDATLAELMPGVTELVLHVGYDSDEVRGAYAGIEDWGADWRQRDLDAALDPVTRTAVEELGIERIGWRALAKLLP